MIRSGVGKQFVAQTANAPASWTQEPIDEMQGDFLGACLGRKRGTD